MTGLPVKVLVLCTGNSCRSQMAEGFLRHYGHDKVEVSSAGLEPKGVHPKAIQVMSERGVDITSHRSKSVSEFSNQPFDYVITVCDNAATHCPRFPGRAVRLHWPFEDPASAIGDDEHVTAVFRRVRDQIEDQVKAWLLNVTA